MATVEILDPAKRMTQAFDIFPETAGLDQQHRRIASVDDPTGDGASRRSRADNDGERLSTLPGAGWTGMGFVVLLGVRPGRRDLRRRQEAGASDAESAGCIPALAAQMPSPRCCIRLYLVLAEPDQFGDLQPMLDAQVPQDAIVHP